MTAWAASAFVIAHRSLAAALAAAPGLILLALYAGRLELLRNDPSRAQGTPAETTIALMVVAAAAASFFFARAVVNGRINRSVGAGAVLSLASVVCVLGFTVVRLV